jgi:Methyltransferase domain
MSGRLERWFGAIVSRPAVYAIVQNLAGQAEIAARLRDAIAELGPLPVFLDVGSAEGGFSSRLDANPVFVDLDPRPLAALLRRRPAARALAADAAALPFADAAFDASLCVAVSHHLDDGQLDRVIGELARVSRRVVFLDALRNDDRAVSRWLWRFDRGRHPRTRDRLRGALERRLIVEREGAFTVFHQYALWVATPR